MDLLLRRRIMMSQSTAPVPPHDYSQDYFTIAVLTPGTVIIKQVGNNAPAASLSYRINNSTWTSFTTSTDGLTLNASAGDRIEWKGTNTRVGGTTSYNCFATGTSTYNVQGNLLSLIKGDDFATATSLGTQTNIFACLFKGNESIISSENLYISDLTPYIQTYYHLFENCIYMTRCPSILPATTLAQSCYHSMFSGCSSLTNAPTLPALTMKGQCYMYMFQNCSNLVTAPELPATTLAISCYTGMFYNCYNLETAPELPATNIQFSQAYQFMFKSCIKLNYIKCLATELPTSSSSTFEWLDGVAELGTFCCPSAAVNQWTRDSSGIPSTWTIQTI